MARSIFKGSKKKGLRRWRQTPNTNAPASRDFYMGVDLGQAQDYTAIVVLGVWAGQDTPDEYHVGHCERLPLGTSYDSVTQHIKELIAIWTQHNQNITLVVDDDGSRQGRHRHDESGRARPGSSHHHHWLLRDAQGRVLGTSVKRDLVAVPNVLLNKKQLKIGQGSPSLTCSLPSCTTSGSRPTLRDTIRTKPGEKGLMTIWSLRFHWRVGGRTSKRKNR